MENENIVDVEVSEEVIAPIEEVKEVVEGSVEEVVEEVGGEELPE